MTVPALTLPVAVLVATVLLDVAGQLFFKHGLNAATEGLPVWKRIVTSPFIGLGVATYALELVGWLFVLAHVPLSIAFPVASLAYCGVAIAGRFVLDEPVSAERWFGTAFITFGAFLVSLSA
ncbi:hypothetical protein MWN34_07395 [Ancylobacter sp. 6x-1]|uniref:Transporter n=1 Tax=Ancylobacter crimeensis TaxID=2579147 RepID=A0ABT0D9X5_9HYPH|nr:hypothetical protein [Ancylobacter crimeensis]MCK0196737.1 hypothetical protein [Ancylobacter crimeensis]